MKQQVPPEELFQAQKDLSAIFNEGILTSNVGAQGYCQRVWRRREELFSRSYPSAACFLGKPNFQAMVTQYLKSHPIIHYTTLKQLYAFLPWAQKNYLGSEKKIVILLMRADLLFLKSSAEKRGTAQKTSDIFSYPIKLQSHVKLAIFDCNLLQFRAALLKNKPIKLLNESKKHWYLIYKNHSGLTIWDEIEPVQYFFLKKIQKKVFFEEILAQAKTMFLTQNYLTLYEDIFRWFEKNMISCFRQK